eukprot:m.33168 g.33168  ORF g.33168 m.33168 type:complete len:308 (-) comp9593_c0_seq1:1026-1949(-)
MQRMDNDRLLKHKTEGTIIEFRNFLATSLSFSLRRRVRLRLWSTGTLGHDNLIHTQDSACGLGGVLQTPRLCEVAIPNTLFTSVNDSWCLCIHINATVQLTGLMGSVQAGNDFLLLYTTVLSKGCWNHLQGLCKGMNGVLLQTRICLCVSCYAAGQLNLGGTSAGHKAPVLGNGLEVVDGIIDSTLNIIHHIAGCSTHNDGGNSAVQVHLTEHGNGGVTDLLDRDNAAVSKLLWLWWQQLWLCSSTSSTAQALKVKLGVELDNQHTKLVAKVKGHVANLATSDNNVCTSLFNGKNLLLQQVFLALGE